MKPEHHKPIRKEKPKRKGKRARAKISTRKSLKLAVAQKWKPITSPQLREAYSTEIEWVKKLVPKLEKKQKPEEKEEPR